MLSPKPFSRVSAPATLPSEGLDLTAASLLAENEQLRTEKLELENSNQILRKFKRVFQQTSQVKCKGCRESFEPLAFKGHVLNCAHLQSLDQGPMAGSDGRQMVVKATQVDPNGFVKFLVSYCGLSWYTQVKLEEVQFVVCQLQQNFPHLSSFTQRAGQCRAFLALEPHALNSLAGLELANGVMEDLAKFEVVRNDLSFRILLQVNAKLEEDLERKGKYHATNSVSLLRQAKQNAKLV